MTLPNKHLILWTLFAWILFTVILLIRYKPEMLPTSIASGYADFRCTFQEKINLHSMSHSKNKLAFIVGDTAFTEKFEEYCASSLGLQTVAKTLQIASSFWVMSEYRGDDEFAEFENLVHSPFYTNKEHNYRYNVKTFDHVYYFINCYKMDLKLSLKLINYSHQINITSFVLITNCASYQQREIDKIESFLIYYQINYVIFKLKHLYIESDASLSANHDIALLMHHMMKYKYSNTDIDKDLSVLFDNELDILYLDDIIAHIASSAFHEALFGETIYMKSNNRYALNYLQYKIQNILNLNEENNIMNVLLSDDINNDGDINIWNKWKCFWTDTYSEIQIDDLLVVIKNDLKRNTDLISRKKDYERFTKSAVFCDTRFDEDMVAIVLNFMINLDSLWQFELFVSEESKSLWKNHRSLSPYFTTKKILLHDLSAYYENEPLEFYTNLAFWRAIKHEKILIFQADSVLCSKSKYNINDFLEYDYIGAPWKVKDAEFNGRVGNGGLSARSKSVMIRFLQAFPQKDKRFEEFSHLNEDCFINKFIALLPGVHLPSYLIAKRFAAEMDADGLHGHNIAVGMHRHYVKHSKDWHSLVLRCPEFNFTYKRIQFGRNPNLVEDSL